MNIQFIAGALAALALAGACRGGAAGDPPMPNLSEATLGALVAERPARARALEALGLDYCCGGRRTLRAACAEGGIDLEEAEARLAAVDAAAPAPARDWRAARADELTAHIVATHHVFMKAELPRIAALLEKVRSVHGERHGELHDLARVYAAFAREIEDHLAKEEQVLFPMIDRLLLGTTAFHCGSVRNPIRVMELEHDGAGAALAQMRALTNGFSAPPDGCTSYEMLMAALRGMETDLHEHIHKENNILHPMVVQLEDAIAC